MLGCAKLESTDRVDKDVGKNVSADRNKLDLNIVNDCVLINEVPFDSMLEADILKEDIFEVDIILVPDRIKLDEISDDDGANPNELLFNLMLLAAKLAVIISAVDITVDMDGVKLAMISDDD